MKKYPFGNVSCHDCGQMCMPKIIEPYYLCRDCAYKYLQTQLAEAEECILANQTEGYFHRCKGANDTIRPYGTVLCSNCPPNQNNDWRNFKPITYINQLEALLTKIRQGLVKQKDLWDMAKIDLDAYDESMGCVPFMAIHEPKKLIDTLIAAIDEALGKEPK